MAITMPTPKPLPPAIASFISQYQVLLSSKPTAALIRNLVSSLKNLDSDILSQAWDNAPDDNPDQALFFQAVDYALNYLDTVSPASAAESLFLPGTSQDYHPFKDAAVKLNQAFSHQLTLFQPLSSEDPPELQYLDEGYLKAYSSSAETPLEDGEPLFLALYEKLPPQSEYLFLRDPISGTEVSLLRTGYPHNPSITCEMATFDPSRKTVHFTDIVIKVTGQIFVSLDDKPVTDFKSALTLANALISQVNNFTLRIPVSE